MAKRWIGGLFAVGVLTALLLCGLRMYLRPLDINYYENRKAEQPEPLTAQSYLSGSFQNAMEKALADQIPYSSYGKKLYNLAYSGFTDTLLQRLVQTMPERYIPYRTGLQIFGGDTLTFYTRKLESEQPKLLRYAQTLNSLAERLPQAQFYVYYIEKDTDIFFDSGIKVGAYEALAERLSVPHDVFRIDSFAEFRRDFYRTDHHWNYSGSYRAYRQLLALLGSEGEPLLPQGEAVCVGEFSGSKAAQAGTTIFHEPFFAYRFNFPDYRVLRNGAQAQDYGAQGDYLNGKKAGGVNYGMFYGTDDGEVRICSGTEGRGKILLLGESFDNALLKLLAAHYDELFAVDLRNYAAQMGESFHLAEYLTRNGIDRVLFIGNIDYFVSADFLTEY